MDDAFKQWLIAAGVRALRTSAQTAAGVLGSATLLRDVSWELLISATLLSGLVSVLTSIGGLPEVREGASAPALARHYKIAEEPDRTHQSSQGNSPREE